jgi:FdrA protein
MIVVHSSTRVWQDMVVLLGVLGLVETPRMFPRGLSCHHFSTHHPKNLPLKGEGEGHWIVDLGEDQFTVGRPHPMIDGTLRRDWIRHVVENPSTAVILLDIILGYGSHPDPVGELLPAIQLATQQAQATGRHVALVASVCGTEQDPQRRSAQVDSLRAHGVIVMPSNAQAARLAALIAARLAGKELG